MIVRLDAGDVYDEYVQQVKWENVGALIAPGNSFVKEALADKVADIEKRTRVVRIERGVDVEQSGIDFKHRGKRIACVGDLSAKSNPMFLLQCMQKLHYLDGDYRLYFAGEFEDKSVEQYVRYMVEVLGLSSVVFFDGEVKNIRTWLRDKHYIVATGIGQGGLLGVLEGMACGLKPVVHNFPGAGQILSAEFLFDLAEDFCRQILSDVYEPGSYRAIADRKHSRKARMKEINEVLVRIEKDIAEQKRMLQRQQPQLSGFGAVGNDANQWREPAGVSAAGQAEPVSMQVSPLPEQLPAAAIPIVPIKPGRLNITIEPPASAQGEEVAWGFGSSGSLNQIPPAPAPRSVVGGIGSINEVAAEAVRVSRALAQAADENGTLPTQAGWDTAGAQGADLNQMGYGSLEACVKDKKISQMASEFSDNAGRAESQLKRAKINQVPFVS
jgi:hypothetical protein